MKRALVAYLLAAACGFSAPLQAQTPAAAPLPKRATSTKPTSPEKLKQLKPLPRSLAGYRRHWTYAEEFVYGRLTAELIGLEGDVVTLRDAEWGDFDVVIGELKANSRIPTERIARLLRNQEHPDERDLLGSWTLVESPKPGTDPTDFRPSKLTFNAAQVRFSRTGMYEPWGIDPTTNPKSMDVGVGFPEYAVRAIYELKGDELRICEIMEVNAKRPTKFESDGNDQRVRAYRRAPDWRTLPMSGPKEVDPELTAAVKEFAALIERDKFQEAVARFVPPAELSKFSPADRKNFVDYMAMDKPRLLYTYRAALRIVPRMSADKLRAEFDFSYVHLEDDFEYGGWFVMEKVAEQWYIGKPD